MIAFTYEGDRRNVSYGARCDGDIAGIRVRKPGEKVHLSKDGSACRACGAFGPFVWTDSEAQHSEHKAKCS